MDECKPLVGGSGGGDGDGGLGDQEVIDAVTTLSAAEGVGADSASAGGGGGGALEAAAGDTRDTDPCADGKATHVLPGTTYETPVNRQESSVQDAFR